MESSPQSGSPSIKQDPQSAASNQAAYMNNMVAAVTSGSGTQINMQTSGGPPPNVVIPPPQSSNPPSVGSTASQAATPIQPHPPTAAIHALPNQLMQQNFSPQANSNGSTTGTQVVQQQVYGQTYSSGLQGGAAVSGISYMQTLQQSSQPHPPVDPASSSSATTSNPINFDAGVSELHKIFCDII